MSAKSPAIAKAPAAKAPLSFSPAASGVLQRKCACGGSGGKDGECEECKQKGGAALQRKAAGPSSTPVAPAIVHDVLRSTGSPLDRESRAFFEPRFGHDFGHVRVHSDARAAQSAEAVNAKAYTVGSDIVLGSGAPPSGTAASRRLLAHELAHTVQQGPVNGSAVTTLSVNEPGDAFEREADHAATLVMHEHPAPPASQTPAVPQTSPSTSARLQRQPADPQEDPERFKKVHETLFGPAAAPAAAPAGAPAAPAAPVAVWDATAKANIVAQFTQGLDDDRRKHPDFFDPANTVGENTTQADAESSALDMDKRLRTQYPFLPPALPKATFTGRIHVLTTDAMGKEDFLRQWATPRVLETNDASKFGLKRGDPHLKEVLDDIFANANLVSQMRAFAPHTVGAFTEGSGQGAPEVSINQGLPDDLRNLSLLHELCHFYAHSNFVDWVEDTIHFVEYSEGTTEYLARKAMTEAERRQEERSSRYNPFVDKVKADIAAFVPDNDIARAYFLGEVWRIEAKSQIAKKSFKEQVALEASPTHKKEQEESRTGPGINETVQEGAHYRFMNLGDEQPNPKPEHVTLFQDIYSKYVANDPTARIRFVGHASSPGTTAFNDALSLKRSKAFYQMARDAGAPGNKLLDADTPPHFGETKPTAENDDVQGRAFNRRVELFITHVAAPANAQPQPAQGAPNADPGAGNKGEEAPKAVPATPPGGGGNVTTVDAGSDGGGESDSGVQTAPKDASPSDTAAPEAAPDAGKQQPQGAPTDAGARDAAAPTGAPPPVAAAPANALSWTQILRSPNDALWFFCGEHPRYFSTDTVLQAQGFNDAKQLKWTIKQGSDKVDFHGAPAGERVTIVSKAGSARLNDVSIEVREAASARAAANSFAGQLTVLKPHHLLSRGGPSDQPGVRCPPACAAPCGWSTQFKYRIVDNVGGTIVGANVNEHFPEGNAKTDDQPNSWPVPAPNGGRTRTGTFTDNWGAQDCAASGANPAPVSPGTPNAGQSVDKIAHEFFVGSNDPGKGCRVQKHTTHRFLGFARQEGITSPAP